MESEKDFSDETLKRPAATFGQANRSRKLYYRIAGAAAILIVVLAAAFYLKQVMRTAGFSGDGAPLVSYIEITVPEGSRQQYILPDRTQVWINAGSTFRYPSNFTGKNREVFLNGEGYFHVAKDTSHPFIVSTAKGSITVTGTTFDVYAYDSKERFTTALLEGHVHVNTPDGQTVNLQPLQKADLNQTKLSVTPIEDPDAYKWMEGLISFDNKPMTEVLDELQNAFGTDIQIKHLNTPHLLLTGKFLVGDGLEYALKVLRDSYGIQFEKDSTGRGYTILK
jgi:ferric-dicitrate binding protein FerR (iron transport regulator)